MVLNIVLNLVPFGRWTHDGKTAQRLFIWEHLSCT